MDKSGISADSSRTRSGVKWLAFGRLLLAVASIVVILISHGLRPSTFQAWAVYLAFIVVCILDVIYLLFLKVVENLRRFALLQMLLDLAVEGVIIYFSGGTRSNFLFLYFASILGAAIILSRRSAMVFAGLASFELVVITVLYEVGYAPVTAWSAGELSRVEFGVLFGQCVALLSVGYLGGTLAKGLSVARLLSDEILGALNEGIIAVDVVGRVVFSNTEAKRLLGVTGSAVGTDANAVFSRHEAVVEAFSSSQPVDIEAEVTTDDGKKVPVRIRSLQVRADDGRAHGAVVVVSDISIEKMYEQVRRDVETAEAVSEMAASIAHEIRNPLTAVRAGIQEIGRSEELQPDERKLARVVMDESDRINRIVSDFLNFARARKPVFADCTAGSILTDVRNQLSRSTGGKNISLELDLPDEKPRFRADAEQVRQALLNVGLNSIAAVQDGDWIRLSARAGQRLGPRGQHVDRPTTGSTAPTEQENSHAILQAGPRSGSRRYTSRGLLSAKESIPGLVFEVSDSGCGMDEETLARAADPFFTTRPSGTGLGLGVVRRIVDAHSGEVDIESSPGQGTRVRIWLPVDGESV